MKQLCILSLLLLFTLFSCNKLSEEKPFFSYDDPVLPEGFYFVNSNNYNFSENENLMLDMTGVKLLSDVSIKSFNSTFLSDTCYRTSHASFIFACTYKRYDTDNIINGKSTYSYKYNSHKILSNCNLQGSAAPFPHDKAKKINDFQKIAILYDKRLPQLIDNDSLMLVINNDYHTLGIKGDLSSTSKINYENQNINQNAPVALLSGTSRSDNNEYEWVIGYINYSLEKNYDFDKFFKSDELRNRMLWNKSNGCSLQKFIN